MNLARQIAIVGAALLLCVAFGYYLPKIMALAFSGVVASKPKGAGIADDITIKETPEDIPAFKRSYTVEIPRGLKMIVTIKTCSFGIMKNGEIDQPDGKWVLFDPENPAEKILDREIPPEVERLCSRIIAFDKEWRDSDPDAYIDEKGRTWRRR